MTMMRRITDSRLKAICCLINTDFHHELTYRRQQMRLTSYDILSSVVVQDPLQGILHK